MENRRSRDSFTKSLQRICQRIDTQRVFEVDCNYAFLPGVQHSRLRVKTLWVVGSYARGALSCGDLDLVAEIIREEGALPLTPTVSRAVVGRFPDVRLYIGIPEENTSGVPFPEAKLVWSSDAPDWNAAIGAIPVDPTASRFEREHDMLPLRREQITDYGDEDTLEKIVDLLEQKVLSSQWVSVEDISVQSDEWSPSATKFFGKIQQWCGKKTQEVMPFVIEWFKDNNRCDLWHRDYNEKTRFKIGGMEVLVGRPCIDLTLLDSLSCSAIVIVPHLSRRGPDGLWVLSRGANHPIEQKFTACSAYYLAYGACPSIAEEIDDWKSIHSLELFQQKVQAETRNQEFKDEDEDEDIDFDIVNAAGSELLSLISSVDIVEVDSGRYPITRAGQFFDGFDKLADILLSASSCRRCFSIRNVLQQSSCTVLS